MVSVVRDWFLKPTYTSLRTIMRPPTARSTRRLQEVKVRMPIECFNDLMRPYESDPDMGVQRTEDGAALEPTRSTTSSHWYEYLLNKPTKYDAMFALERADIKSQPRSLGCAHLNVSQQRVKMGHLAEEISIPFGNVSVVCSQPKRLLSMPTVTFRFFVLTMNASGHINWPFEVNPRTKAMLRIMVRRKLKEMLESERNYPINPSMQSALTVQSDGRARTLRESRAAPRLAPQQPRVAARFRLTMA